MVSHCRTTPGVILLLAAAILSYSAELVSASTHQQLPHGLKRRTDLHGATQRRAPTTPQSQNDGSVIESLLSSRGLVSGIVCQSDQYLSLVLPTGCVDCTKRDPNATTCNALGSTSCSYGVVNSSGVCKGVTCTSPKFPSADGSICIGCSANATACDSTGKATGCSFGLLSSNGSCLAAPCPSGVPTYLLPNGTACIDCQKTFGSLTSACNATSAISCSSGSINSTRGCSASLSCIQNTQFLSSNGSACIDCKTAYGPLTATCTSSKALTCLSGGVVNSTTGACSALTCSTGSFLDGTSCSKCSTKFGANALTCDSTKALSCSSGVVDPTTGACGNVVCTSLTSFLNANGTACIDCKAAFGPLALTCNSQTALTCLSGAVLDGTTGACSTLTCLSGTFLGNNGTACIDCKVQFGPTALTCDSKKALTCSSGVVNATTGMCSTVSCTPSTSFLNANGTACVVCKTAWGNNTLTCDSTHALTCSTGLVNGTTGMCSQVTCPPQTSFMSANGTSCIDCKTAYGNTTSTCDSTKALSCATGGSLNSTSGRCDSLTCLPGFYLGNNGTTCLDCVSKYGVNTLACDANKALNCSRGVVNATTGACTEVSCAPLTSFLNANGTACIDCKAAFGPLALTCNSQTALTCLSGAVINGTTGACSELTCLSGSFLGMNGTACVDCALVFGPATLTCDAKTALTCSRGLVNTTTGVCNDVVCPLLTSFANANATACIDCKTAFGKNTLTCDALHALTCSTGLVDIFSGNCTSLNCTSPGTFLGNNGTACLNCVDAYGPSTLTCDNKTALTCSRGVVNSTTGTCSDVTCTSPGTFVNANGTACGDCKKTWGPDTSSCNALTALNCTTGSVNATGFCSTTTCATGTYLSVTNTTCLSCPYGLSSCSVFLKPLSQGGTIRCIGSSEDLCGLYVECPPGIPVGANGECVSGQLYGHYEQTQQVNYNADSDFYGAWSLGLADGYARIPHIPVIEQAPYYTFEGGAKPYGDLTITAGYTLHSGGATLAGFDSQGGIFKHSAMAFGTCAKPFSGLKLSSSNPPGACLDIILSASPQGCWIYNPSSKGFVACPKDLV